MITPSGLPDTSKVMNFAMLLGLLIVVFIVYKLMATVGIIKTGAKKREEAEKVVAVEMMRTDEYWNPSYSQGRTFKQIGSNAANVYAQTIRRAIRGPGTDEEAIYVTFGKLYNKANISEIASLYEQQYGKSLQTDLLNDLSEKEIAKLMNIINGLPNN